MPFGTSNVVARTVVPGVRLRKRLIFIEVRALFGLGLLGLRNFGAQKLI